VLLLSFGGPERGEDVLPYLENVTRGRGIPPSRLEQVARHYHRQGGRSPINDCNRALLAALHRELASRSAQVPLLWGNRNWDPYLVDALREGHRVGARRVLAVVTSAYASYSGCRQYREDVAAAVAALRDEGVEVVVDRVRHFFNHPGFVAAQVEAVRRAIAELDADPGGPVTGGDAGEEPVLTGGGADGVRLVFVTHSVPVAMDETSGPEGGWYVRQHLDLCHTVADRVARTLDRSLGWDLAYCSRSGPPGQPWLEPDVNDHLATLRDRGVPGVVIVPIGFVSDHMEVVHDLDVEAMDTARALGIRARRAATAGTDPQFVAGLVDLLLERAAAERGEDPPRPVAGSLPASPDVCAASCCPNPRGRRPAACEAGWSAQATDTPDGARPVPGAGRPRDAVPAPGGPAPADIPVEGGR
jgi:ferrochelatase